MIRAQSPCVFKEDICLFLTHLAEYDDIVGVLWMLALVWRGGTVMTYDIVLKRNIIVM